MSPNKENLTMIRTSFVLFIIVCSSFQVLDKETKEIFMAFDLNKNGELNFKEVCQLLQNSNVEFSERDVIDFINIHDRDGDGQISYDEFKLVLWDQLKARARNLVVLFETYDFDKDGTIDFKEFSAILQSVACGIPDTQDKLRNDLTKKYFPNADSTITFIQFCDIFKEYV